MKCSAQAVAAGLKVQLSPAVFCCGSGGSDEKSAMREACQKPHGVLNNTGTQSHKYTHAQTTRLLHPAKTGTFEVVVFHVTWIRKLLKPVSFSENYFF